LGYGQSRGYEKTPENKRNKPAQHLKNRAGTLRYKPHFAFHLPYTLAQGHDVVPEAAKK